MKRITAGRIPKFIGQQFGRLKILRGTAPGYRNCANVECECSCGTIVNKAFSKVITGIVRSCGCLRRETARKNGQKRGLTITPGDKIGRLKVLSYHGGKPKRSIPGQRLILWRCLCPCGKERIVPQNELKTVGRAKKCGCNNKIVKIGDKYSRLAVTGLSKKVGWKRYWNCLCVCGNTSVVDGHNLVSEAVRSCGCLQKEKAARFKLPTAVRCFAIRTRSRVRAALTAAGLVKNGKTFEILGYSPQDLYNTLKVALDKPCTVCKDTIVTVRNSHIDHNIPLLTATSLTDIIKLNQLSNLRLICPPCNLNKIGQDHRQRSSMIQ